MCPRKILKLHKKGLTNRAIAKEMGWPHWRIGYLFKKLKIKPNGTTRKSIEYVGKSNAKCSKCDKIQSIKNFLLNRVNAKYPYRLSYCNDCRKLQLYANLNGKPEKFLKDRFNRLQIRAKRQKIPFDLSFKYYKDVYFNKQKSLCFYSKEPMIMKVGKGYSWDAFTIDKVVPDKGYIVGNIVFCKKKFNTAKNCLGLLDLKNHIPRWYNKIKNTTWLKIGD